MRNNKLSILLITLRSDIGGGPKHVYELASALKNDHKANIFIAAPLTPPYGNQFKNIADNFFELPARSFDLLNLWKLFLFCRQNKIRLIHSHGRGAGIYSRLLFFFGFKIIHTYHGIHKEPGIKGTLKIDIDRFLEHFTTKLIFVSNDELHQARKYGLGRHGQVSVINNGIMPPVRKSESPEKNVLGTLARLTYQKGLDILINYFFELDKKYPDAHFKLKIAGSGEDRERLQTQIDKQNLTDKVLLVGETKEPQKFLEQIDIYVSTSRWEGLPLSVLEAMYLKIPCILSSAPGHTNFLVNNVALPASSAGDFLENVYSIATNSSQKAKLCSDAYYFIELNHTHRMQVQETLNLYKEAL